MTGDVATWAFLLDPRAQRYLQAAEQCHTARLALHAWSSSELGQLSGCVEGCAGCQQQLACAAWRALFEAHLALDTAVEELMR